MYNHPVHTVFLLTFSSSPVYNLSPDKQIKVVQFIVHFIVDVLPTSTQNLIQGLCCRRRIVSPCPTPTLFTSARVSHNQPQRLTCSSKYAFQTKRYYHHSQDGTCHWDGSLKPSILASRKIVKSGGLRLRLL